MLFNGKTLSAHAQFSDREIVFVVEYGVTSWAEVDEAVKAGKICFCKDGVNISPMFNQEANGAYTFKTNNATKSFNRYCQLLTDGTTRWGTNSFDI